MALNLQNLTLTIEVGKIKKKDVGIKIINLGITDGKETVDAVVSLMILKVQKFIVIGNDNYTAAEYNLLQQN